MIKGNGIDIIEVERIKKILHSNDKFLERIFTTEEINYITLRNYSSQTIAGMFAAKEAISKALGSGIRGFNFRDIEIIQDELGKPEVKLKGNAKKIAQDKGIGNIYLSISHIDKYAVASAIAEEIEIREKDVYVRDDILRQNNKVEIISINQIKDIIPRRKKESHKGTYGRIAVIAGSKGMTGAAYLTSMGALRSGSGIVYTLVPSSLYDIMSSKAVELIVKPIDDCNKGFFINSSFDGIMETVSKSDVVAIGPGLGMDEERVELVARLLNTIDKPVVLDADGINCVARCKRILRNRNNITVITPHPGELSRLLEIEIDEIQTDRIKYAGLTSERYGVITVLKGSNTVIAGEEGELFINPTGNPGMATAGSGDVLTGIITSLIGQGISPMEAAVAGVYIHGLAGDLASDEKGEYGMIASDILEKIPSAIRAIVGI